jgi:hypothetical protein
MGVISQSPKIAVFFGAAALITSLILIFNVPRAINYLFSVFWLITGLLALYTIKKR